jgi:diguanylate cyclase (GGDEF)-like protein
MVKVYGLSRARAGHFMYVKTATFSPPTWALTRWLAEPPAGTSDAIRAELARSLFGTLPIFFGGIFNTILVALAVTLRQPTFWFKLWLALEVVICLVRLAVLLYAFKEAREGRKTPTDIYLVLALCWGASVGLGTFLGLVSGDWVVATLTCLSSAAMVGGICFRNFGAPRLASLMIVLSLGPTCPGAIFSGEPILMIVFLQIPFYLFSMSMAAFRLNRMLVATMAAEQESGYRARHDDLTGLSNRAHLMRLMDERLEKTRGGSPGFALFYLDLDGFKAVNDTRGHAAGDRVLQMVADKLNGAVRIAGVTARIGGDEFVVLIDGISQDEALAFGERLVEKIAHPYDLGEGVSCEIGVSVGISCAPEHGRDARLLLAAADGALYAAKAMGKCRVAMAGNEAFAQSMLAPLVPEAGDPLRLPQPKRTSA